jgi:hypothetical protein
LKAEGESLFLSDGSNTILDQITFGPQMTDITTGRYPNGTGPFVKMLPTFDAVNSLPLDNKEADLQSIIQVFPQPVGAVLYVKGRDALGLVRIFNLQGVLQIEKDASGDSALEIEMNHLPAGAYLLQINGRIQYKLIKN